MKYSIRSVLVIALVALQLGAVVTILLSSYLTSERVLLGHARDLMLDVANETIEHSVNFLEPAEAAADLSQRLAQQDVVNSENVESLEKYFFEQLRSSAQFSGIFYGNEAGAFVYVKRDDSVEGAAYRTKVITVENGERRVSIIWRSNTFELVVREPDPNDSYDPRTRPWYERARARRGVAWTDPYIFFTSKNPGITVGAPVLAGQSSIQGVVGVDIEIVQISDFLAGLTIGKTGRAFLLNRNGDVLAHPEPALIKTQRDGSKDLRFTQIDELEDPASQAAFFSLWSAPDDIRVTAPAFTTFELDGEAYTAVFAPLPQKQWPWIVGIYVPENDFLGAIKENRRDNILIALAIAAVTAAIGLLLARGITRPIAALYSQADRIARGEWPRIGTLSTNFRELARAGTAFNRMASWLDGYKEDNEKLATQLRSASRELEVRVEERTAALTSANQQLRGEIEDRKIAELELAQEVKQHQQTAQALREARDQADAASAAKSQFLSNMSHELRTPMNVILGYGQLLKRKGFTEDTARASTYLGHILESGNQLISLIDQILDLARIESGRMLLSIEPVDIGEMLSVIIEQGKILARQKGVEIIDRTDRAALVDVMADRDRLKQALMNLLSNAIKYNRPGGKVILRSEIDGAILRVSVQDTGLGIPPDKTPELFEPFNRLGAENSGIEGTGVGLALTKELVERMGGRLGVDSIEGVGSTFGIELTIAKSRPGAATKAPPAGKGPRRLARNTEVRVLYVEDHAASRVLVIDVLSELPQLKVETAATPEESLAKAKTFRPDLVIVDINLPDMDGFALIKRLRSEAACADTPMIALSADAMPDHVLRGQEAGFARYLTKPIDLKELQAAVFEVLDAA